MRNIHLKGSDASDFVNDETHSHKHSSQDHVNTPKKDLRNDIDALNEKCGTSKPCDGVNSRHDRESTTSTEANIPSNNDDNFQDETFSHGGNYNLRPNPKPKVSHSHR